MAGYSTFDPNTTDSRKIAGQTRNQIYQQGQQLTAQQLAEQQKNEAATAGTQDYLGSLESPNAEGLGGFNPNETSQIEYTPQDAQNLETAAGISAGVGNAASVGAVERAADAAGGNPAALMAYRARAAQQQAGAAGDAATAAKVQAKGLESQGAQTVGNARLNQENQGLQYFNTLQGQQNQNAQQDLALQNQTYGTETTGENQAGNLGLSASQTPSTFDKVLGAASGAASAFLEDGSTPSGTEAVVGENGPEKVVDMSGVHNYMDDGGMDDMAMDQSEPMPPAVPAADPSAQSAPWWKKLMAHKPSSGSGSAQPHQQQWNPTTPYQQIGQAAGAIAGHYLEDGGYGDQGHDGIFTRPTDITLERNEAVVPLNYRVGAKIRPSMAALPAARVRRAYGA